MNISLNSKWFDPCTFKIKKKKKSVLIISSLISLVVFLLLWCHFLDYPKMLLIPKICTIWVKSNCKSINQNDWNCRENPPVFLPSCWHFIAWTAVICAKDMRSDFFIIQIQNQIFFLFTHCGATVKNQNRAPFNLFLHRTHNETFPLKTLASILEFNLIKEC